MAAKFELKRTANGQVLANLRAGNGEVILTSETYVAKAAAKDSIAAVRVHAPTDARYARRNATNGQHYFVLAALNGRVLGTSEKYSSAHAMEDRIDAVKREAPDAPLVDLT
jgi:uncharacterized protein